MVVIGPWPTKKLIRKWKISPRNQTDLYACFASTTFWHLQQQLMSRNQSQARNPNFGWLHMCKLKSGFSIVFIRQFTKINKNGLRPRLEVGKTFSKRQWLTLIDQYVEIHSRSKQYSNVNSSKETISQNGCSITNIKTKPNTFVKHWVNKLNMSKADRDLLLKETK